MPFSKNRIAVSITVLIVTMIGFVVGTQLFEKNKVAPENPIKSPFEQSFEKHVTPAPQPKIISDRIYTISPPSTGVILRTTPIEIGGIKNDTYSFTLPSDTAADMKINMNVLTYDANNVLLPDVIGKITSMIQDSSNQNELIENIVITFFGVNQDEFKKIKSGKIVLKKEIPDTAMRLPYSAIVKDKDNNEYVWEVGETGTDTTTVTMKPANITYRGDSFVGIEPEFGASNIYILNPDEKLQDSASIQTTKTFYQGPTMTIDEIMKEQITQAITIQNNAIRKEHTYTKPGEQTPSPNSKSASGCTPPTMSTPPESNASDKPAAPKPLTVLSCKVEEDATLPLLEKP